MNRQASVPRVYDLLGYPETMMLPFWKEYLHLRWLLTLTFCIVLAACNERVVDVEKSSRPFTAYGYLDPTREVQTIRVFPIRPTLVIEPPYPLDATLSIREMETGHTVVAVDSIVPLPDGDHSHVFVSTLTPQYDASYEVVIERSDGALSNANVIIPPFVKVSEGQSYGVRRNNLSPAPYISINFSGGEYQLIRVGVRYDVEVPNYGIHEVLIPYEEETAASESGYLLRLDLSRDFGTARDTMKARTAPFAQILDFPDQLILHGIAIEAFVVNEEWERLGASFDQALVMEPGVFSNVTIGFGFLGGGYLVSLNVYPHVCLQQWAGFEVYGSQCTGDAWCRMAPSYCQAEKVGVGTAAGDKHTP